MAAIVVWVLYAIFAVVLAVSWMAAWFYVQDIVRALRADDYAAAERRVRIELGEWRA